jgi:glycosyltransferase involved in cell wall biosynthesis
MSTGSEYREGADASRRRLLVCTPVPPRLDLRHGARATAQLLARLAARHEVALLCLRSENEGPVDEILVERCAHVEEIPVSRPPTNSFTWRSWARLSPALLRGVPPWVVACQSDDFEARLRVFAAEWQPDIVEIHVMAMAQYVSALEGCRAARILVDYDPPSAWAAELMRQARGPRRLVRRGELAAWRRYERATRKEFDAIVVFAEHDVAAVSATAGGVRIVRIPIAAVVPERALNPIGEPPPRVLFVGGFGHPPNVDAALWLARSIFPRVLERIQDARLELVGDRPGEDVRRLAGGAVAVYGSVPDVTPYLDRAAVVVAPIRLGGSMRGKVLEALVAGKALVATPRAAAGLEAVPREHFVLARTEDEIGHAIEQLLADPERRRELAGRARAWASSHLTWDRPVAAFERLYETLSPGGGNDAAARSATRGRGVLHDPES